MEEQIKSNLIPEWSLSKKVLVIFLISYLLLYIFPFPLHFIPYSNEVLQYYDEGINYMNIFVANKILNVTITDFFISGKSGDTMYEYIKVLSLLLISVIVSISLNIIFRKKSNFQTAFYRTLAFTGIYLGCIGLSYGLMKIFEDQFWSPLPEKLDQSLGNFSPMELLWTFIGYSRPYAIFGGILELIGGLLLFFKKTRTIGALIFAGVMSNVVMLNFCYDVPVKLFSSHILLFSIIIILPDIKNLFNFFILRKPSSLINCDYGFRSKALNITCIGLKYVMIAAFAGILIFEQIEKMEMSKTVSRSDQSPANIYRAESFTINGNTISQLNTNYRINIDSTSKTAQFLLGTKIYTTPYYFKDDALLLKGFSGNDSINAVMRKKDLNEYLLLNREFKWIIEIALNR